MVVFVHLRSCCIKWRPITYWSRWSRCRIGIGPFRIGHVLSCAARSQAGNESAPAAFRQQPLTSRTGVLSTQNSGCASRTCVQLTWRSSARAVVHCPTCLPTSSSSTYANPRCIDLNFSFKHYTLIIFFGIGEFKLYEYLIRHSSYLANKFI